MSEEKTLQILLAAQVLTLAATLETLHIAKHPNVQVSKDYKPEAIALIARESAQIIARLVQSQALRNPAG